MNEVFLLLQYLYSWIADVVLYSTHIVLQIWMVMPHWLQVLMSVMGALAVGLILLFVARHIWFSMKGYKKPKPAKRKRKT